MLKDLYKDDCNVRSLDDPVLTGFSDEDSEKAGDGVVVEGSGDEAELASNQTLKTLNPKPQYLKNPQESSPSTSPFYVDLGESDVRLAPQLTDGVFSLGS